MSLLYSSDTWRICWIGFGGEDNSSSSDDESECFEGVEDGGDLVDALFGLAPEAGGEDFCILADGGQQLADGDHLRGQFGGPIEDDRRGGVWGGGVVA